VRRVGHTLQIFSPYVASDKVRYVTHSVNTSAPKGHRARVLCQSAEAARYAPNGRFFTPCRRPYGHVCEQSLVCLQVLAPKGQWFSTRFASVLVFYGVLRVPELKYIF
jgi:hypothetical protein